MEFIKTYFNAERYESLLFIVIGIAAIAFSLYFVLVTKTSYMYGISTALVLVALIQIVVGTIVFVRSPKDIERVEKMIGNKEVLQKEEVPRMEVIMKNFVIYRYVEMALIVLGLIFYFINKEQIFLKGLGLGLAIQAAFMLGLDYFAERRGHVYVKEINVVINEANA